MKPLNSPSPAAGTGSSRSPFSQIWSHGGLCLSSGGVPVFFILREVESWHRQGMARLALHLDRNNLIRLPTLTKMNSWHPSFLQKGVAFSGTHVEVGEACRGGRGHGTGPSRLLRMSSPLPPLPHHQSGSRHGRVDQDQGGSWGSKRVKRARTRA